MAVKLLTPHEVAKVARLSLKTVYRAIWAGELDATFVRNRWRISEPAVLRWLAVEAA
jgi:excisionase family DNA binding protein